MPLDQILSLEIWKQASSVILEIAEKNGEFAYGVGVNLGEDISAIGDKKRQEKIWELVEKNSEFALGRWHGCDGRPASRY